jgi:tetratricopeptide (TPR) repeat protein
MRALEIDEQLAEAHASIGWTMFAFDWDWPAAERELRRSIELNPSYATAHRWLANSLTQQGRHEEALAAIQRGLELDPVSLITNSVLAYTSYMARLYDKAIEEEWRTLELDDQFAPAHWVLGMALEQKGQLRDAISAFQKATALDVHPIYVAALGHAYGVIGQREQSLAILHRLAKVSKEKNLAWNEVAIVYLGMGEKEKALAILDTACKRYDSQLNWLKAEPRLDPLRSDARFADLLRRMNLPQ